MSVTYEIPLLGKLQKMTSPQAVDSLVREVAVYLLGETKERIHERGLNAKGAPIGTYTASYLRRRTKPPYNRNASSKVILSLTGRMENDYVVIPLGNSSYGLGFTNSFSADKAKWNEERFGKVYALTPNELKQVSAIVQEWISKEI